MFNTFREVIAEVKRHPRMKLCVAAAADEMVLQAVKDAVNAGFIDPILVGSEEKIWKLSLKVSLDMKGVEIINEANPVEAARRAAQITGSGGADVLMKGMVNSSDFLRAVLKPDQGLTTGRALSHLGIFEIPGFNRLIFMTDGGLIISPDLEQKKQIILNALDFLQVIGLDTPRVAVLSAESMSGGTIQSAEDAKKIRQLALEGYFGKSVVEGPVPLGPAIDIEEALLQGMDSPDAGKADLLVVPGIEVGNVMGKTIIHFAGGRMAGLVIGAAKPMVLTSRAETPFGKLSSIAFACYYSIRKGLAPLRTV